MQAVGDRHIQNRVVPKSRFVGHEDARARVCSLRRIKT